MTVPAERSLSIEYAEKFLLDLLDPKATPKVPKEIRERARRVLRHFPNSFHVKIAAKKAPEIFGVIP